jgi:hypothetical protein
MLLSNVFLCTEYTDVVGHILVPLHFSVKHIFHLHCLHDKAVNSLSNRDFGTVIQVALSSFLQDTGSYLAESFTLSCLCSVIVNTITTTIMVQAVRIRTLQFACRSPLIILTGFGIRVQGIPSKYSSYFL